MKKFFIQSDDNRKDEYRSLKARFEANKEIRGTNDRWEKAKIACKTWFDVRAFGQLFAFGKSDDENAVSIGIRGPVTIQIAVSVDPVDISNMQITKCVNLETNNSDPDKRGSDTMGMKHRVEKGIYVTFGSINCQLAEKTGFSDEDAEKLHEALKTIFENDESAARPAGSMEVIKIVWWKHNCKTGQYSSAKVHSSLDKMTLQITPLDGLETIVWEA